MAENIEFLEINELAEWLKVTPKTIYNLIYSFKKGKKGISDKFYLKVGKKVLFIKALLNDAILKGEFIC